MCVPKAQEIIAFMYLTPDFAVEDQKKHRKHIIHFYRRGIWARTFSLRGTGFQPVDKHGQDAHATINAHEVLRVF